MDMLRRAIVYLVPLLRVMALGLAVGLVILGAVRGVVWITADAQQATGVEGPQTYIWKDDMPEFGGLSALVMTADGARLLAAGDHGTFFEARVARDGAGHITGIADLVATPVSLASGLPPSTFKMDIEALSPMPDGTVAQAFEGFVRIETLRAPQDIPVATHRWDRFFARFGNVAFEALATLPGGRLLAITEGPVAPRQAGTVIHDGRTWRDGPPLPVGHGFAITGADLGPDGCLYLVERRFGVVTGFTFRLRRLSGSADGWQDTALYTSPPAHLGNAEGLSAWQGPDGRVVLSVVTDNNFLPLQKTRLMEFRVPPGDCRLGL